MIKATCTWGDGEDILVDLNGHDVVLYEPPQDVDKFKHGVIRKGSFFLTKEQAQKIVDELQICIQSAKELDSLMEGMECTQ